MFRVMNHDVAKGKHFEIPSIYVRELSKGRDEVWLISVIEINGTSKCLMQNQSCPIVFWRVIKKGYLLLSHPFNACMLTVETYIYSTLEWPLYWLWRSCRHSSKDLCQWCKSPRVRSMLSALRWSCEMMALCPCWHQGFQAVTASSQPGVWHNANHIDSEVKSNWIHWDFPQIT